MGEGPPVWSFQAATGPTTRVCALATIRKWNPLNCQHRVQFDEVRSSTDLAMVSIEETYACDPYDNRFISRIWRHENLPQCRPRFGEIFA